MELPGPDLQLLHLLHLMQISAMLASALAEASS